MKKVFESKIFAYLIWSLIIFTAVLLVFKIGVIVGSRQANFSCQWGDNYHKNFAGPKRGFGGDFNNKEFMDANGLFGQIIKVDGHNFIIRGKNDMEVFIRLNDGTIIKRFKETVAPRDLTINDMAVIIGEPNNVGQIDARFVRLLPPPGAANNLPEPRILPFGF